MLVLVQKVLHVSKKVFLNSVTMCIFVVAYLLKLLCDHGKSSEDCLCGPCDGNYSLWG